MSNAQNKSTEMLALAFARAIVHGVKAGEIIYYSEQPPHEQVVRALPEALRALGLRPEGFRDGIRVGVKAVAL